MRNLRPLLAAAALVLSTAPAYADLGDQVYKLLPDDGAASDLFGRSVAISGATAVVGAYQDDDNGGNSGSAYLFSTTTGMQTAKLLPDDGAANDHFGFSVAISGATTIVGAQLDADNGTDSGSAYLFDTTTGTQMAKLLPNDAAAFDHFGFSVAISGATAIVGAPFDDDNGNNSGSAYLFDTTTGTQIAKLLPNDDAGGDRFGSSVAISGATAIVGAYRDDDSGDDSGSAYLFDISDPAKPTQIVKLLPNDGAASDEFGFSVAISDATAIVGARRDADNGTDSGSAYLFDTTTGTQIAKLLPDDGAASDEFGFSVAISGATGIVGALHDGDNGPTSGSAYLFDTTDGRQLFKLLPIDGEASDQFGLSVAIRGATAIVGADFDDDNGAESGSAYLFEASSCPWDVDNNGSVGASDLLLLLFYYGMPCKDCPFDFDGDGNVGASDLLALLFHWGPCP
ncbi:MAG: FG-GAP repeat protein [Phycisphaerales bacterium]